MLLQEEEEEHLENPVEFDHVVPVLIFLDFIRSSKLQISHNRHAMRKGQRRAGTDVGKVG